MAGVMCRRLPVESQILTASDDAEGRLRPVVDGLWRSKRKVSGGGILLKRAKLPTYVDGLGMASDDATRRAGFHVEHFAVLVTTVAHGDDLGGIRRPGQIEHGAGQGGLLGLELKVDALYDLMRVPHPHDTPFVCRSHQ